MNQTPPASNRPQSSAPPRWLPKDQQRFALLLAAVAVVLVGVVLSQRSPAVAIDKPLKKVEQRIRVRHRNVALQRVESACRRTDCDCVVLAAGAGLDADAGKEVLELLDSAEACTGTSIDAIRAEALVRAGKVDEGIKKATSQLADGASDAHAASAVALALYAQGQAGQAMAMASQAIQWGAGDGARLLLGLVSYNQGDVDTARKAFADVLKNEPDDTDATYNLGTVAQRQNRYGEARKLFLAVLRMLPKHKESRYNLGILAHSIGAAKEAQHHLEKLKAIAPGDPLVSQLESTLATAPPNPPTHVLNLGTDPKPRASAQ